MPATVHDPSVKTPQPPPSCLPAGVLAARFCEAGWEALASTPGQAQAMSDAFTWHTEAALRLIRSASPPGAG
jgi:hypothetical protein